MILPWNPVIIIDITGSLVTLGLALFCVKLSLNLSLKQKEYLFRDYLLLLTISFAVFAVSRSFGHLLKHLLIFLAMRETWNLIAPVTGAINTSIFICIFSFCIYFQKIRKTYLRLENYKDNLEDLISLRTKELEDTNTALARENNDRKNIEEDLRQSKRTLENIFNSAMPLCITDLEFNVLEANNAYKKIWPGPNHHTNIKCFDSRSGDLCHTDNCPLALITAGEEEVICETIKAIGPYEQMEFIQTTKPFRDADNKLIGVVTSFQEITKLKQIERALAAERENLAVTLRSIGDGVITTDTAGRILILNKVAEKICGWRQHEAIGRPLPEVLHIVNEQSGKTCPNPVDMVLESGGIIFLSDETTLIARDGTKRNIADSGAPIRDPESKIIGVVLVIRDITEKRRMEHELLKVKKLESVGLLAGGIAHDFNNILTSILGNINLAKTMYGQDHAATPMLEDAHKASLRARTLTNQLLTFSKGGSPIKETASISSVIQESASFILHGTNITISFDIPDNLWLIEFDRGQMSQVIQNIILNSRQAMPDGGNIIITCNNHQEPSGDKWVKIKITDSGHGIPANIIDDIFDPYFTTSSAGSGMGLAICHSIISKHDGRIEVQSRPGMGSTFTITLPAGKTIKPTKQQDAKAIPAQKQAKILLMDDEEMVSSIAKQMLMHLGHEVIVTNEGAKAVETYRQAMAKGQGFDLVIMDLTIPGGMGGKEAVREVLALNPDAKVIVVSGYSNDPVMADHKKYGFSGFLNKPFELSEIKEVIQKLL